MIELDEDALICDLAETYHIYHYRQLPLYEVAVFAYGLGEDSRIKMKLFNQRVSHDTLLLASAVDRLTLLLWTKTKDGQKGVNRPKSIVDTLLGKVKESRQMAFHSSKEFEQMRKKLLGKEND